MIAAGGVALPIAGGNVHVSGSPAVELLQTDLLPVLGGGARVGHAHWGGVCQRQQVVQCGRSQRLSEQHWREKREGYREGGDGRRHTQSLLYTVRMCT